MLRILALAAALSLSTCATAPVTAGEICQASVYGVNDGYNGRRTASGERFNTYASSPFTAAHRTIPFGTIVRVKNLRNGRVISVKIQDRGPYVRRRCIDLGRAAADALGIHGLGMVEVSRAGF